MSSQRSPTKPRPASEHEKQRKASVSGPPVNPYAPSEQYYKSLGPKPRTYSALEPDFKKKMTNQSQYRRGSDDPKGNVPVKYRIKVEETLKNLKAREDTNEDGQITIKDGGPKTIQLATKWSNGLRRFDVRGTYMLSNLLQELTIASVLELPEIEVDEARLNENPVHRLSRKIRDEFWPNLTRRIDGSNIKLVAKDTKVLGLDPRPRIYVPKGAPRQLKYYQRIAREQPEINLDVRSLAVDPGHVDFETYVRDLNDYPGLLAIEMEPLPDLPNDEPNFRGLPFVVPGGRFNELYGWDSYMETLGLLIDGRSDLGESMVKHFCFCIKHYGKILNANRTYYLCRSQPPFLTDMALRVFDHIKDMQADSADFLKDAMLAAIKDYYTTWMTDPRLDKDSGLSCYRPGGLGVPPETEATHFENELKPYAEKLGITFDQYVEGYTQGRIVEPKLDEYFRHDRSIRESGHDTSYRLEKVSADLATVDLNSCLYKYEIDIARTIRFFFGDRLEIPNEWHVKGKPNVETSSAWETRAKERRKRMNKLMWNEEKGMFFDYNVKLKEQTDYESATTFWAMWAGAATPAQAATMVRDALPLFEKFGGLTASTKKSRGEVGLNRPNRQWDYPNGWAPQQILAWTGLLRYGFEEDAQRLAYRWIYMCTKAFMDYNGVVVEKYNVLRQDGAHEVSAEYGNQGADFKGGPTEGFGWVNASYVYGLQIVNEHMKRALSVVTPWWTFYQMTNAHSATEAEAILEKAMSEDSTAHGLTMPIAQHVFGAASPSPSLAHSDEGEVGHTATHGATESRPHHGPGEARSGGAH